MSAAVRFSPVPPAVLGDEKYHHLILAESTGQTDPFLLRRIPCQTVAGNLFFFQSLPDDLQHGGKLGKQQDPVSARDAVSDQIHTGFQLRASFFVVGIAQGWMAADLAQAGEGCQHLKPVLLKIRRTPAFPLKRAALAEYSSFCIPSARE